MSAQDHSLLPLTRKLLETTDALDYDALLEFVHTDYQVIDIDNNCNIIVLDNLEDWSRSLLQNINTLKSKGARLKSTITDYREAVTQQMAYSVVHFHQEVRFDEHSSGSEYVATIVWQKIGEEWKEAHWHCSVKRRLTAPGAGLNPEAITGEGAPPAP